MEHGRTVKPCLRVLAENKNDSFGKGFTKKSFLGLVMTNS